MNDWVSRDARTYLGNTEGISVASEFGSECIAFEVGCNIQLKRYGGEK